jgi:hypothetical protein
MKVFLSWSGKLSHEVAVALREWLPCVIQSIKPWVSSEDIEKGTHWNTDIARELKDTLYGIFCITKDNQSAPWVNFEAGAISKMINEVNVSPLLIDIIKSDVRGPLTQFQLTIVEKADVWKLVQSMNSRAPDGERVVDATLLEKVFDRWWPDLEARISAAIDKFPPADKAESEPREKSAKILEELLELARNQQRLLANPTALMPPEYLGTLIEQATFVRHSEKIYYQEEAYENAHMKVMKLEKLIGSLMENNPELTEAATLIRDVHEFIHDLSPRRFGRIDKHHGVSKELRAALDEAKGKKKELSG